MTISRLPAAAGRPDQAEPEQQEPDDALSAAERDALAQAAVTGQHAADWIRTLAARQQHADNRRILERYADAVEQVLRREIIPGSEGELTEELRYTLDAYVLCGSVLAEHRPELTAAERIALLAVGFSAASAPRVVLNDLAGDLALLCEAIDQALAIATMAQPATSEVRA
ncbi:hypothetical protein [Kitasatospora sp. NBC_01302]|uniref:hypothetical protein n=1 Tax=Kitasatospora sp. NBC_01302 TaxID=2903575 RepID=UPI002E14B2FF|nr:hypothetical protein OG294_39675 [Kitasatospora sp. NBC_01302]